MQIWAHRGASGEFPENTLLAFEQAIVQGADGIELDVFQVENDLYIWHDRFILNESGQALLFANQSTSWVDSVEIHNIPQKPEHIPTLKQALELINGRCAVNVEVKHLTDIELLIQTLHWAIEEKAFTRQQFLISSFDHDFLESWRCRELFMKIGLLSASTLRYMNIPERLYSIHLCIDCLRKADVQRAHDLGYKVLVYTVDSPLDIQQCLDLGVDGIFSNFPARSRRLVEELL